MNIIYLREISFLILFLSIENKSTQKLFIGFITDI